MFMTCTCLMLSVLTSGSIRLKLKIKINFIFWTSDPWAQQHGCVQSIGGALPINNAWYEHAATWPVVLWRGAAGRDDTHEGP